MHRQHHHLSLPQKGDGSTVASVKALCSNGIAAINEQPPLEVEVVNLLALTSNARFGQSLEHWQLARQSIDADVGVHKVSQRRQWE